MGGVSIVHWLIVLIAFAVIGVPIAKILKRAGYSGWLAILAFVPLVNIIGLWLFANAKWTAAGGKL